MEPIIDTTQFRDAIKKAFKSSDSKPASRKFSPEDGVLEVPASDKELLGEGVHPPYTIKYWAGYMYQKREDGKWDKIAKAQPPEQKPKRSDADNWKK